MEEIRIPKYQHNSVFIKSSRDWTYNFYNIDKLHKAGFKGEGIKIGVIDTGINWKHKEFEIALSENRLNILDSQGGNGFDGNGHGTWAISRNIGTRFGMVPKCTIYSMKSISDNGGGSVQNIVNGYHILLDIGVDIISGSFGFPKGSELDPLFSEVAKRAASKGTMLFNAAGNDGQKNDIDSPAFLDGFISVGGFDSNMNRSVFSDLGIELDLYAPGNGKGAYIGQSIAHLSGTSMATPIAAANFAMIKEYLIKTTGKADYQTIKNIVSCH